MFPDESRMLRSEHDAGTVRFRKTGKERNNSWFAALLFSPRLCRVTRLASLPTLREQVDSLAWLQQQITVIFPDEAEIMYIGVRGCPDRTTAEALTNAVVKVYLDDVNPQSTGQK